MLDMRLRTLVSRNPRRVSPPVFLTLKWSRRTTWRPCLIRKTWEDAGNKACCFRQRRSTRMRTPHDPAPNKHRIHASPMGCISLFVHRQTSIRTRPGLDVETRRSQYKTAEEVFHTQGGNAHMVQAGMPACVHYRRTCLDEHSSVHSNK
jgi:hypothetical protein